MQEILSDEIEDEEFHEFVVENLNKLLSYIESGRINIKIHRDITGEMWFGMAFKLTSYFCSCQPFGVALIT